MACEQFELLSCKSDLYSASDNKLEISVSGTVGGAAARGGGVRRHCRVAYLFAPGLFDAGAAGDHQGRAAADECAGGVEGAKFHGGRYSPLKSVKIVDVAGFLNKQLMRFPFALTKKIASHIIKH